MKLQGNNGEEHEIEVKFGLYAQSNMNYIQSNAGNAILVDENKNFLLSPQVKSPFIEEGTGIKLAGAGGMMEDKDKNSPQMRALRELEEEQAAQSEKSVALTGLIPTIPYCTEMAQCFLVKMADVVEKGELQLDKEGEFIGKKKPFGYSDIIENKNVTLTTKYYATVLIRLNEAREPDDELSK